MFSASLYDLIGKPVEERYGRFEGRVVAVETKPTREVSAIVYENGGVLIKSNTSSFRFNGTSVVLAPSIIFEAEELCEEMDIHLVQQQVASNLKIKGLVSEEIINEVKDELDAAFEAISAKAEELTQKLNERLLHTNEKRNWIYRLFMNLEVARNMNLLKDDGYSQAHKKLEEEKSHIHNEIEDIERLTAKISSTLNKIKELRAEKEETESPFPHAIVKPETPPKEPETVEIVEEIEEEVGETPPGIA